jgi:phosphoribosylformylglycinamidine cyclo-ligase
VDKPQSSLTYASSGVNIERAESFVNRLKKRSARAGHKELWKAAGGYAAVYPLSAEQGVAVTTDGVGTKLLVANELADHSTIGIDLVAMCANDLICVGATADIFLDYFAVGKLEDKTADAVIEGIIEGCDRAGMLLAGGETAEMPGLYEDGHYDLAGFAVGHVDKKDLLTGAEIAVGQTLIAVASSGIHSNGLSLARKALPPGSKFYRELLTPTSIYVKPVTELFKTCRPAITGVAHITGGGWRNVFRLNSQVGFSIEAPLPVPAILQEIGKQVEPEEMYKTFNMGMGLCVIARDHIDEIVSCFAKHGFAAKNVGTVTNEANKLVIKPLQIILSD